MKIKLNHPTQADKTHFKNCKRSQEYHGSSKVRSLLFGILFPRQELFLIALGLMLFAACKKSNSSIDKVEPLIPDTVEESAKAGPFGPFIMHMPAADDWNPGALYARAVQLNYNGPNNGKMYATFERYMRGIRSFPIFESTNGGRAWTKVADLSDQVNGWGMVFQPQLYELPQQIGSMPAGTLLCAGVSVPTNDYSKTKIDLYKSNDLGRNWAYVGSIAAGGNAVSDGNYDPVWEPFLLVANNKLICYYADETDPAHNQKIVHKTSTDGTNWSGVVHDVALGATLRPGMPTVAKMANGQYIMTYEIVGIPGIPTHCKISSDAESWDPSNSGTLIKMGGSPVIVALSSGKLVMNNHNSGNVYTNDTNGTGVWTTVSTPLGVGYSRGLVPLANGQLFIISGGWLSNRNNVNYASITIGN